MYTVYEVKARYKGNTGTLNVHYEDRNTNSKVLEIHTKKERITIGVGLIKAIEVEAIKYDINITHAVISALFILFGLLVHSYLGWIVGTIGFITAWEQIIKYYVLPMFKYTKVRFITDFDETEVELRGNMRKVLNNIIKEISE